jgi:hypothetical protein
MIVWLFTGRMGMGGFIDGVGMGGLLVIIHDSIYG